VKWSKDCGHSGTIDGYKFSQESGSSPAVARLNRRIVSILRERCWSLTLIVAIFGVQYFEIEVVHTLADQIMIGVGEIDDNDVNFLNEHVGFSPDCAFAISFALLFGVIRSLSLYTCMWSHFDHPFHFTSSSRIVFQ